MTMPAIRPYRRVGGVRSGNLVPNSWLGEVGVCYARYMTERYRRTLLTHSLKTRTSLGSRPAISLSATSAHGAW